MRSWILTITSTLISLVLVKAQNSDPLLPIWDTGFRFADEDQEFVLEFGGRIMYDFAIFDQPQSMDKIYGTHINRGMFRRVRTFHSGTLFSDFDYKFQVEFAGDRVSVKDAFIEINNKIPGISSVRLGQFKEPFRLEMLTSSRYNLFMERSFISSLSSARNFGIMLRSEKPHGKIGWQLGFFNRRLFSEQNRSSLVFTGRLVVLPIRSVETRRLMHLGVSYSYRRPNDRQLEISLKPESHLSKELVSTGLLTDVDHTHLVGLEYAFDWSSFSFQGEYAASWITRPAQETFYVETLYGQVSYLLTGETRYYKGIWSGYGRLHPGRSVGNGGLGAWQIAVRYGWGNLGYHILDRGRLKDWTMGLNWLPNSNARITANYIFSRVPDLGTMNVFQMRFQLDY